MLDLPVAEDEDSHEDRFGIAPKKRGQSGRVLAPDPRATRVRVEIAGRAHRGKLTTRLGISPQRINVKKNQPLEESFSCFFEKNLQKGV